MNRASIYASSGRQNVGLSIVSHIFIRQAETVLALPARSYTRQNYCHVIVRIEVAVVLHQDNDEFLCDEGRRFVCVARRTGDHSRFRFRSSQYFALKLYCEKSAPIIAYRFSSLLLPTARRHDGTGQVVRLQRNQNEISNDWFWFLQFLNYEMRMTLHNRKREGKYRSSSFDTFYPYSPAVKLDELFDDCQS
jgi:hypothetical protein